MDLGGIIKKIKDLPKLIVDPLMKPLKTLIDFFKKVGKVFKNLGLAIKYIIYDALILGLGRDLGLGFWFGILHILYFVQYSGEYMLTNLFCGVKFFQNFTKCFFWYVLDILGKLTYLIFFTLPILFLEAICLPAKKVESYIWDRLEELDRCIFDLFGFHIIHFPKSVRDRCYNCKRLKEDVFTRQGKQFQHDVDHEINPLMTSWIKKFKKGGDMFVDAFKF